MAKPKISNKLKQAIVRKEEELLEEHIAFMESNYYPKYVSFLVYGEEKKCRLRLFFFSSFLSSFHYVRLFFIILTQSWVLLPTDMSVQVFFYRRVISLVESRFTDD